MIKKIFLFALFTVGLSIGLTGCLGDDNKITTSDYAIVGHNSAMGGITLTTYYIPEFAAPELEEKVNEGDCVFVTYTINYDDQPSKSYVTATDVKLNSVFDQSKYIFSLNPVVLDDPEYNKAILNVSVPCIFKGKFFAQISTQSFSEQTVDYSLICAPSDVDAEGNMILYIKAKISGKESGTQSSAAEVHVFDIADLIKEYGKVESNQQGASYRHISVLIKYCSDIDGSGICSYKTLSTQAITLYMHE